MLWTRGLVGQQPGELAARQTVTGDEKRGGELAPWSRNKGRDHTGVASLLWKPHSTPGGVGWESVDLITCRGQCPYILVWTCSRSNCSAPGAPGHTRHCFPSTQPLVFLRSPQNIQSRPHFPFIALSSKHHFSPFIQPPQVNVTCERALPTSPVSPAQGMNVR